MKGGQQTYPEVYSIEFDKNYPSLVSQQNPNGKGTEGIYFVSTKEGIRIFIRYMDKQPNEFDEVKPSPLSSPWSWNHVEDARFFKLSDERLRELMEDKGLARILEHA